MILDTEITKFAWSSNRSQWLLNQLITVYLQDGAT